MVKKAILILLLAGICTAQAKHKTVPPVPPKVEDATKPAEVTKLPDVPAEWQAKFLPVVIKQKDIQIEEQNLQTRYAADEQLKATVNAQGQALEAECVKALKLDPEKFVVQYKDDKMVVVAKEAKK
jgi:hypothetical protein